MGTLCYVNAELMKYMYTVILLNFLLQIRYVVHAVIRPISGSTDFFFQRVGRSEKKENKKNPQFFALALIIN